MWPLGPAGRGTDGSGGPYDVAMSRDRSLLRPVYRACRHCQKASPPAAASAMLTNTATSTMAVRLEPLLDVSPVADTVSEGIGVAASLVFEALAVGVALPFVVGLATGVCSDGGGGPLPQLRPFFGAVRLRR